MMKQEGKLDIVYLEANKFSLFLIISFMIVFISNTINLMIPKLDLKISDLVFVIMSVCILIIYRFSSKVNKNDILAIVSIPYAYWAVIILFHFLPSNSAGIVSSIFNAAYDNYSLEMFVLILTCCFIGLCLFEKTKIKRFFILIISIAYTLNYIFSNNYSYIWLMVLNFISVILCILSWSIIRNQKLVYKGKINDFLFFDFVILVIVISNVIVLLFGAFSLQVVFYQKYLFFIIFMHESIKMIDIAVNEPYMILFSNLYNSNKHMDVINNKIYEQNRELEYSRMVIKKKNNMIDLFFKNMPIPLVIIDRETERIGFANKSFLALMDEDKIRNIINKKVFTLVQTEEVGFIKENDSIIRGKIIKNGKFVDIEIFDDEDEKSDEVIIIFTDVTERIKMQKMQESIRNKEFEEKIKRDFLSNISHDLKTPINVIFSANQLIDVYSKENNYEGIKKYNDISKTNCFSLIKFTNNLIDRSKIVSDYLSAELRVYNVVEVVEDVVMSLVDYAKTKDIDIIFDTDEEEFFVLLDINFMKRVILNIVSNSIKYCNNNGKININITDLDDKIMIVLEDNGIGMDKDILKNAFNRYSMGKNSELAKERGTGIGLFVVKRLVEQQKGEINIFSQINKGTRIEMLFNKVEYNEEIN